MALHPDFLSKPIAHRGLHDLNQGTPENSPKAFRRAIARGYGIELDLQCSADGRAMVFHDPDLDRLTDGSGLVKHLSAAELGEIPLKNGHDTIPTLADTLAMVNGRVPVLIEIKDQDGQLGENIGPIGKDIARQLAAYKGAVALMSYSPFAVADVSRRLPDLTVGLVTSGFKDPVWSVLPDQRLDDMISISSFDRLKASFISHNQDDLNSPHVVRLKAQGVPILCWTVRNPAEEAAARKIADNITFEGYLA
jgi:glycerophosphoryl diester phosphodiesterase